MLKNVKEMRGFTVAADDGAIGEVKDVYFDDERWAIRYLVVETGGWLSGRKVLISPLSVHSVAWTDEVVHVSLRQQQVTDSPGIDTDKPVSRQNEIDYSDYYGYPSYWEGANLWGLGVYPIPWVGASPGPALGEQQPRDDEMMRERRARVDHERDSANSHLRSSNEVIGHEIMASDGPIGTVEDFIFDEQSWAIRYMIVDTRKWLPGKHVLLSTEWIDSVNWPEREVRVKVTRHAVETSPPYEPSHPLSREHETGLYDHYEHTAHRP